MSELKCNCGRATHTGLGCGPDLPRTPYDRQAELATLRAENARLRAALERIGGHQAAEGPGEYGEGSRIGLVNKYGSWAVSVDSQYPDELPEEIEKWLTGLVQAALAGKDQSNG